MNAKINKTMEKVARLVSPARLAVIVAVTLFFWLVVLGDKGIYQLQKLTEMKHRLIAERKQLNDDIDNLNEEKRILSDPAKLEMIIRKELGYIKPGEVIFEEKKEEKTTTPR